jgi:hypothetical protein
MYYARRNNLGKCGKGSNEVPAYVDHGYVDLVQQDASR